MKKLMTAIALGATIVAAPVLAQGVGGGFMQRDQTRQEAKQRADMLFQMLDLNHDGVVTRQEAEQAASQFASRGSDNGARSAGRMQRIIEGVFGTSQSITLQQFEAQSLARFDAQDLNHDGVVTALERQQAREARQAQGSAAVQPQAPAPAAPQAQPPRQ